MERLPPFIKGLELAALFYAEAVRPVLAAHLPQLVHAAARLDTGSDVLGFDTPQSRDHGWGPMLTLFVAEADYAQREQISGLLARELPRKIHGYPTNFYLLDDVDVGLKLNEDGPVNHGIKVTTVARFFAEYVGLDPSAPISELAWLAVPPQRLRTIAAGRVFHDGLRQLEAARARLRWYPRDVWLYLLANQWRRIDQEAPFMARCGDVGDELGARVVAARLVNELMRLCFLMEQQYPPYYKWFGSAFAQLACAARLTPHLHASYDSRDWHERERHLSAAYIVAIELHNALNVSPPIEPEVVPFHTRPYLVPPAGRIVEALHAAVTSPAVKALPPHVGAIWQFADSTDVIGRVERSKSLTNIYRDASDR